MVKDISGPQSEQMNKSFQNLFNENELKLEIQCNLKVVDYLDVTLNLNDVTHKPYRNTMQPESHRLLGCDFELK